MLYVFTGQPGHGKTLHAIERVIEMKAEADKKHKEKPEKYPKRELYICNVRDMRFAEIGAIELSADEFKGWADSPEYLERKAAIEARGYGPKETAVLMEELHKEKCATEVINPKFLNAIVLIDEAYEHGLFPKRAPGAAIPRHVERVAKHRHYGMDMVLVSQSPDKQCDSFLHDLIERHVHVRRRFGTQYVHLREFDKFEANAEKALPLVNRRGMLPKKIFGLYKSTELDTTERKIPWFYIAFFVGLPVGAFMLWYTFGNMDERLLGDRAKQAPVTQAETRKANGASATVAAARTPATADEYLASMTPRIPSQPWTAPAYDGKLSVSQEPPRVFCSLAGPGEAVDGDWRENSKCSCLTEQGTRYRIDMATCAFIASEGQYEPYLDEKLGGRGVDGYAQVDMYRNDLRVAAAAKGIGEPGEAPRYGQFRNDPLGPERYEASEW